MNRFGAGFALSLMLFAGAVLPHAAHAAVNLPFFNPEFHIVPDAEDFGCEHGAPFGLAAAMQTIQNFMNVGVSLASLGVVIVIIYAGVLFMTTSMNPEGHTKARTILLNAVVGFVIVLAAWLIVDFVMKAFYNPDSAGWGPWNELITGGGDFCIEAHINDPLWKGTISNPIPGVSTSSGATPSNVAVSIGTAGCSPSAIQSAAAAGGYTLTSAQADTFSCLAKYESACGANKSIPKTVSGQQTSARGMFQITLGASDTCHSLNIPVCTQAAKSAGWAGSGNLNCSTAFSAGRVKPGMEALANACNAAAQNLSCNASAAACLLKNNPSFSDWTADSRASKQASCIAKFNT